MRTVPYRSWIEVSRKRIAENFKTVRSAVGAQVEVMPVVKTDAYRHGAVEVSRVLETEGTRWLAVNSVEEGLALRQSGITTRILVMAGILPGEIEALMEHNLTPVIHSLEGLRDLERKAARRGQTILYHLKVDSGMGRLGTSASVEDILTAISETSFVRLEGLMTHFASAADYIGGQTEHQIELFDTISSRLKRAGMLPRYRHMCSTIAIAYGRKEAWCNMVRPGHAIYGYVSPVRGQSPPQTLDVKPALEWKATLIEVKDIPAGTLVGYGGMFRTTRSTRIGILAVGYADGLAYRLSNKGKVIAAGRIVPILGAVSMDLTTIDLSDSPSLKIGDSVTLLGSEGDSRIDAQQIARIAGTISYSILCGISSRVKRIYL